GVGVIGKCFRCQGVVGKSTSKNLLEHANTRSRRAMSRHRASGTAVISRPMRLVKSLFGTTLELGNCLLPVRIMVVIPSNPYPNTYGASNITIRSCNSVVSSSRLVLTRQPISFQETQRGFSSTPFGLI